MLVVCYDEHGGFFDHVAPLGTPSSGSKKSDSTVASAITNYGVQNSCTGYITCGGAWKSGAPYFTHATVFRTIMERFMPGLLNSVLIPETVRRYVSTGRAVRKW